MPHPIYTTLSRVFRRWQITSLGLQALRAVPDELDLRELVTAIMRAKGLNGTRRCLAKSVVTMFERLVH